MLSDHSGRLRNGLLVFNMIAPRGVRNQAGRVKVMCLDMSLGSVLLGGVVTKGMG
jgi:hypothetical protein